MVETSSSATLIAQATRFLDDLGSGHSAKPTFPSGKGSLSARAESGQNGAPFSREEKEGGELKSASEVEANLAELERFREEMHRSGFGAPFMGMSDARKVDDLEENELADLKKQLRKMKGLANAKKFTLNRIMVAIAAHKIAMRAMERGMPHIAHSLPLGGNYIARLVRHGEHAVSAYGTLLNALSAAGRGEGEKSVIVKIEHVVDGKKIVESVKLMSEKNIEARVKRAYGAAAQVVGTEIRNEAEVLVRSKSVRACAASAYASMAAEAAAREFDEELRKNDELRGYLQVLAAHGFSDLSALETDDDKYFAVMDELVKKGIASKDGFKYSLHEGIEEKVDERRAHLKSATTRLAMHLMALDLLKYYMSTPLRKRENEPIFPGLSALLSERQTRMFDGVGREIGVENAGALLLKKADAEKMSAGIRGELFGAAFFSLESKKPLAWCAEFFGVDERELKEARAKVEALRGGSDRAKKFMELVKGARKK